MSCRDPSRRRIDTGERPYGHKHFGHGSRLKEKDVDLGSSSRQSAPADGWRNVRTVACIAPWNGIRLKRQRYRKIDDWKFFLNRPFGRTFGVRRRPFAMGLCAGAFGRSWTALGSLGSDSPHRRSARGASAAAEYHERSRRTKPT